MRTIHTGLCVGAGIAMLVLSCVSPATAQQKASPAGGLRMSGTISEGTYWRMGDTKQMYFDLAEYPGKTFAIADPSLAVKKGLASRVASGATGDVGLYSTVDCKGWQVSLSVQMKDDRTYLVTSLDVLRDSLQRPPSELAPSIREAQRLLDAIGYHIGQIDGVMGRRTRAAIERFEAENGMPIRGDISEALLEKLRSASPAQAETSIADDSTSRSQATKEWTVNLVSADVAERLSVEIGSVGMILEQFRGFKVLCVALELTTGSADKALQINGEATYVTDESGSRTPAACAFYDGSYYERGFSVAKAGQLRLAFAIEDVSPAYTLRLAENIADMPIRFGGQPTLTKELIWK